MAQAAGDDLAQGPSVDAVAPWTVRNLIRWTPPTGPVHPTDVPANWPSGTRAIEIAERYQVATWRSIIRPWEVAEAAYVLALLDEVVPDELRASGASGRALDVGCKGWSYLAAQRAVVPSPWDGVEIDANRRVGGLQTRASIARWRIAQPTARGCGFIAGSVSQLPGPYRLVTWFLPFVRPEPHRRWGLPRRLFDPEGLLTHVWSIIEPGGVLIVSNQDAAEAQRQGELFASCEIDAELLGPVAADLSPFTNERPVWRAIKAAS